MLFTVYSIHTSLASVGGATWDTAGTATAARSRHHGGRADALTLEDLADLGRGARRPGRRDRRGGQRPDPEASPDAHPATPVEGAEITIALGPEPTSLDPHLVDDGGERAINDNIYETLLTRTPDGEPAPDWPPSSRPRSTTRPGSSPCARA